MVLYCFIFLTVFGILFLNPTYSVGGLHISPEAGKDEACLYLILFINLLVLLKCLVYMFLIFIVLV